MAVVTITEEGIITFHGVNMRNRLIIAQHCANLHEQLMAQVAEQNGNYAAEFAPRQPESEQPKENTNA